MYLHLQIKFLAITLFAFSITACDKETPTTPDAVVTQAEPVAEATETAVSPESNNEPLYVHHAAPEMMKIFEPWTGDLPELLDRRVIRALVPWSDTYYYLDGAKQKGIAFEALQAFEKWLNEEFDFGTLKPHIAILPVRRDQLIPFIAEGRGDLALGGITITEDRLALVDFSEPTSRNFNELLVEAPGVPRLAGLDDLSGEEVHVPASSSYWQSLLAINEDFGSRGLDPVRLIAVDEYLSTEDLMQLANAGAIPYTVADSELALFWKNALPEVRVREDIIIRENAQTGLVLRKNSPEFKALLNRFVAANRQGTLTGNIIINRYLRDTSRLGNIHGEEEQKRLRSVISYFRKYAPEHDFDTLMIVAQGFQESRLDQTRRSHRGAVGIMQLLPSTAREPAVAIEDITIAENNILAGIRYMAWIKDTYFDDPELDGFNRTAMAFASYNAGPNRVRGLRKKAETRGLDPNVWFDNVELIAAEEIGRETVDYVANIFKYYFAFKLTQELKTEKQEAN